MKKKIVILGAGPTGLAAGRRLIELGFDDFIILERKAYAGGLCASFTDDKGFVWDLGGHVIFSHYAYFDGLLDYALGDDYVEHKRDAWIRTQGHWVPYPFQNNINCLPQPIASECLAGLAAAQTAKKSSSNFEEWIFNNLGDGIARHFMLPYNQKVWAYPLDRLSTQWMSERVSQADARESRKPWGPNAVFRYPLHGGTATIFAKIIADLKDKIKYNAKMVDIDTKAKTIRLTDTTEISYDTLISTIPLTNLVSFFRHCPPQFIGAARQLIYNSVFIVGIGIHKPVSSTKCWMYFPDNDSPFFRVTYLSNYSSHNVPDNNRYYSLLCESSYSAYKKEDKTQITEKTIQGLINSGILKEDDRQHIVSTFLFDIDFAYPVPTLERDELLSVLQPALEELDVHSRGRFGAWKYEISNTDHSVIQGKEVAERIIGKGKESVWSL